MNAEPMTFDETDLIAVPVTIGTEKYVLREANADASAKYHDAIIKSTRMSDGKIVGSDGLGGVEQLLVSLCLHRVRDGKEETVPMSEIRRWKSKIVKALADRVKQISELDARDDADPKDAPAASTA